MKYIYDKADCRFSDDDLVDAADWFEEHLKNCVIGQLLTCQEIEYVTSYNSKCELKQFVRCPVCGAKKILFE